MRTAANTPAIANASRSFPSRWRRVFWHAVQSYGSSRVRVLGYIATATEACAEGSRKLFVTRSVESLLRIRRNSKDVSDCVGIRRRSISILRCLSLTCTGGVRQIFGFVHPTGARVQHLRSVHGLLFRVRGCSRRTGCACVINNTRVRAKSSALGHRRILRHLHHFLALSRSEHLTLPTRMRIEGSNRHLRLRVHKLRLRMRLHLRLAS